ncbi:hypothetical protein GCM10022243_29220 [Saccharothrix violaceirubra]
MMPGPDRKPIARVQCVAFGTPFTRSAADLPYRPRREWLMTEKNTGNDNSGNAVPPESGPTPPASAGVPDPTGQVGAADVPGSGAAGPSGRSGPDDTPTTTSPAAPPPYRPATAPEPPRPDGRGRVRNQESGRTKPKPPSLAVQRAREQAVREEQERQLALEAEQARKRKTRKRLLIGGGVAVGVVGVVAIWYAASSPDDVEAQCTKDDVVVDDQYCDPSYASTHGGYTSGGFIYIGGSSYRYHYGGTSTPVGSKVSGGSYTIPKGSNVTTKSGTVVQRGGFGVSGGSKSGGS